jgi:uncharacterized protein (DUF58 family)
VAGRTGFTTRASCLLAAGITAIACGLLLGVADLARVGVLASALPLAASVVVRRSRVRLANRRAVTPVRSMPGADVTVSLTVSNHSLLPVSTLLLEDHLPDGLAGHARFVLDGLTSREARTVSYHLPALGRGRYRVGPLQVRLTDPFHLVDVTRSFTTTSEFVVVPVVDHLGAGEPPRSFDVGESTSSHSVGAHGADDASTREYRTGDDLRKIHWRSSARMGALMVRQEERPWHGSTTVLLDLRLAAHAEAPPGSIESEAADVRVRSSLEWAVSAAASISTHVIHARRQVGLLADPARPERTWYSDPGLLADYLSTVRGTQSTLGPFAAPLRSIGRDSVLFAVLGSLDPDSLRLLAESHARGSGVPAFAILLDVASWRGESDGTAALASSRALQTTGWRVQVVRRGDATGRIWRALLHGDSTGVLAASR